MLRVEQTGAAAQNCRMLNLNGRPIMSIQNATIQNIPPNVDAPALGSVEYSQRAFENFLRNKQEQNALKVEGQDI